MKAIVGWLPSVSLMLFGAMISQDIELHVLAGSVLLLAGALILLVAYSLDKRGP